MWQVLTLCYVYERAVNRTYICIRRRLARRRVSYSSSSGGTSALSNCPWVDATSEGEANVTIRG
jgi:hypothetical protein